MSGLYYYNQLCSHNDDPEDRGFDRYGCYFCPSSISEHPVRHSLITNPLNRGIAKVVRSEREIVSQDVLEQRYDARSEREK